MHSNYTWICIFLVFIFLLILVNGRQDGICVKNAPVKRTRSVRYQVTYRESYKRWFKTKWRTSTRDAFRTETYTDGTIPFKYCCQGYSMLSHQPLVCQPVCSETCTNGRCSAPETCQCNNGFSLDPKSKLKCNPICTTPCENSNCSAPETCSCHEGYYMDPGDTFRCKPGCSQPCFNGICSGLNTCSCKAGHIKDPLNDNICLPVCSKQCINGKCSSPEICRCNLGFIRDAVSNHVCNLNLTNGNCTTLIPEKLTPCSGSCKFEVNCECNDGYQMVGNSSCVPKCFPSCRNGHCVQPNVCDCYTGYARRDEGDPNWWDCLPVCEPSCINGQCSEPNQCVCNNGYTLGSDNFTCRDDCVLSCDNGSCQNGICSCNEGFTGVYCKEVLKSVWFMKLHFQITLGAIFCILILTSLILLWYCRKRRRYMRDLLERGSFDPIPQEAAANEFCKDLFELSDLKYNKRS